MSDDLTGSATTGAGPGAACPGCRAVVPDPGGVKQPTVGASPGCWAAYGDLVAREYSEWHNPPIHRLTVDAYAAQHPGRPSSKAILDVAAHLIALYLAVDRGVEAARVPREIGRAVADPSEFRWLEPPSSSEWLTIVDVRNARDLKDHTARVRRWARTVWEAWSAHHDTVRSWAGR
ncbi:MAG TPA: DUF5946 family protein [Longimicrobiales bacterium]|nr:DUF5946 family protein [Longimicrobiales bacterium]